MPITVITSDQISQNTAFTLQSNLVMGNVTMTTAALTVGNASINTTAFSVGNTSSNVSITQTAINSGGSTVLGLPANGNVGVGTTTPRSKLEVSGGPVTAPYINIWATTGNYAGYQFFGDSLLTARQATLETQTGTATILKTDGATPLILGTNASERMRIDSSGNVGIGTTSSLTKLDVVSNDNYIAYFRGTRNGYLGASIWNNSNGSSARSYLQIGNDTSQYATFITVNSSTNTTELGGANALGIYQGLSAPIAFATAGTERMRIDSSGRITTPNQPAFNATFPYTTTTTTWPNNSTDFVSYPSVSLNRGNAFNATTGAFTAPVAGAYRFTVQIAASLSIAVGDYTLNVNGAGSENWSPPIVLAPTSYSGWFNGTVAAILNLNANDYVTVRRACCDNNKPTAFRMVFSGELIG